MAGQNVGDAVVITSSQMRVDPVSGAVSVENEYDGAYSNIVALTNTLVATGARVVQSVSGGVNRISATWSRDPEEATTDEVPADVWDDDTVTEEIDLFATQEALQEAYDYAEVNGAGTFPRYKKYIEDAVADGEPFPFSAGESGWPVGYKIWKMLSRGIKGIPISRPVITRRRTFSSTYESRNRLEFIQKVWTPDKFKTIFNVPESVRSRLPETPTLTNAESDFNLVWGWKMTVDSASYNVRDNKISETKTFVFASWSRELYTIVE
jgi:hypothetical protein